MDSSIKYYEKKKERRIRDRLRMIKKAIKYELNIYYANSLCNHKKERIEMYARYNYNHLKKCSCDMCCNPRHSRYNKGKFQLTLQERRIILNEKEQLIKLLASDHY